MSNNPLELKINNTPASERTVESAAKNLFAGQSFTHQASVKGVEVDIFDIKSYYDALEAICVALAKTDWYWSEGSAYCPACVLCESPAIDPSDSQVQRGGGASVCSCCGTDYEGDIKVATHRK